MKKYVTWLLLSIIISSCGKEETFNPDTLPQCTSLTPVNPCITKMIDDFKTKHAGLKNYIISRTTYRGQLVFLFAYCPQCDGPTVLINNCCNTIGELCGDCYPDAFHRDFIQNSGNTTQIWP